MLRDQLCISIPEELLSYSKQNSQEESFDNLDFLQTSSVEYEKNTKGVCSCAIIYNGSAFVSRKIFYEGSSVVGTEYYFNNVLTTKVVFKENKIESKILYSSEGKILCEYSYDYDKKNRVVAIKKIINKNEFLLRYDYDELGRLNDRKLYVDSVLKINQHFRYDILDRIVEYKDSNQQIRVLKLTKDNCLISYEIIDKIGNIISVENNFINDEYQKTEITLNGHRTIIIDKSYVDNIMLKKPSAQDEDIDIIIANLLAPQLKAGGSDRTMRTNIVDISEEIINKNVVSNITPRVLPISMRKRLLYNMSFRA